MDYGSALLTSYLRVMGGGRVYILSLLLPELAQIAEEFQLRCGSTSARMSGEVFSTLMTQLGYPTQRCMQCFK